MSSPVSFYSTVATDQAAQTGIHDRPLDSRRTSGVMKAIQTEYALVNTEAATDKIYLARIRKGMLLVPISGIVNCEAGWATSMSIHIGVEYDSTDLTDDADIISATLSLAAGNVAMNLPAPYEVLGEGWLVATIVATVTPVATKKMQFFLPYLAP